MDDEVGGWSFSECSWGEVDDDGRETRYGAWGVRDADWAKQVESGYEVLLRPVLEGRPSSHAWKDDNVTIPNKLHHIWLGGALPERFKKLRDGWIALHAGWEVIIWDDAAVAAELAERPLHNKVSYEEAENLGARSDILRLELLHRYGGVYVDVDFECLKSLSPLIEALARAGVSLFCGVSNVRFYEVNNGLIGATPGHPFLQACMSAIESGSAGAGGDLAQSMMGGGGPTVSRTGPGMLTRMLGSFMEASSKPGGGDRHRVVALPSGFFYPLPNTRDGTAHLGLTDSERKVLSARRCVFAAHLWAKTWQRPEAALRSPAAPLPPPPQKVSPSQQDIVWLCNIAARGMGAGVKNGE